MARTKAYDRQIYNAVRNINRRLADIEKRIGMDSEQYRRYINTITAAAPAGTFSLDPTSGRIRMKTSKSSRDKMKIGQLRATLCNPTASQSIKQSKKQLQKTKQLRGDEDVSVSDMEALEELKAKQKIQDWEDDHGKLRYLDEAKEELSQKGAKSYTELADIMERAKEKHAKKEKKRESNKKYWEANKDRINARRREQRAEKRRRGS